MSSDRNPLPPSRPAPEPPHGLSTVGTGHLQPFTTPGHGAEAEEVDANDVACLAAGDPGPLERAALLEHVGACPGLAALAGAVAEAAPPWSSEPGSPPGLLASGRARIALALTSALALGLLAYMVWPAGSDGSAQREATEPPRPVEPESRDPLEPLEQLEHEVERIVAQRPDATAGLRRPGSWLDLQPGVATVERGGLVVCSPRGARHEERPTVTWVDELTAGPWDVQVISSEGAVLWTGTSTVPTLAWPTAGPGLGWGESVVVSVAADVGGLVHRGSAATRRLDREEELQRQLALQAIDQVGASPWQPLLRSRVAQRYELWAESWSALQALTTPGLEPSAEILRRVLRTRLPCETGR